MIKVTGRAYLIVEIGVELDMTEEQFDSLSSQEQDELLDSTVDWKEACRDATVDSFEIDDLDEIEESA